MHWVLHYLGQRWTEQTDCYYWFARIQQEQFGRLVPWVEGSQAQKAQALLQERRHHWHSITKAALQEGDAVLMYQTGRTTPHHHIGVWSAANGGAVLHAPEGGCIQLDDPSTLALTGWAVREYLTYA